MEIQLEELFVNIHDAEMLYACNDLWADVSIDEGVPVLDGLYIITTKEDFYPLYQQGHTLTPQEHGHLFDAAEAYLKSNSDDLVTRDYEEADNSDSDAAYEAYKANSIMQAAE